MNPTAHQGQDLFAAHVIGKSDGVFLDIGSGDPFIGSNSAWLESLGWSGWAIDRKSHNYSERPRTLFCMCDAAKVRLPIRQQVDFLSIDVDDDSYLALLNYWEAGVRPKVICIEHDAYRLGGLIRDPQREFLKSQGYHLIPMLSKINDAWVEWEDWWIKKNPST